ncbi:50S ribosomal protein L27 [Patescibacteria group bacterium]|nr:50S ribosomal protein L27 [Patescibacteria group bacterium]MBU1890111.1 50S ribosomal protein L27 [Patescibacteria group bacterium]
MAHTKSGGTTGLGRDSQSKRLGVKLFGGQKVAKGNIIVRQRGTKYHPGENVKRTGDDTIMSLIDGVVKFTHKKRKRFDGSLKPAVFVNVVSEK